MIHTSLLVDDRKPGRLVIWSVRNQVAVFFVFTFLISWTIWGVLALFNITNETTLSRIILIGAYAPALSALLLSTIATSEPWRIFSARWWAVFLPALFAAAGIEWLDHIYWKHKIDSTLILVDAILVFLAALVITRIWTHHRDTNIRFLGKIQPRDWVWFLVALVFWPLLVLAGNAIARFFSLSVPPNPAYPSVPLAIIVLESLFWALLFGGPLNEEPGWRGFALPRLQSRFNPLIASIIIGVFWGLWHAPLHLMGVYPGGLLGIAMRFQEIPRAILFTWLYNRTKGSLLVVCLFHAAINTTSYFMARSYEAVFVLLFLVAIPVVLSERMWRRLPEEESAVESL